MDEFKKNNMLSIIIPTKNEEKYIDKCLNSLNRAIVRWRGDAEIILIDNGSNDKTIEIAKKYKCIIIESKNGYVGKLRNIGARISSGEILGFLDADCLVDINWIIYCLEKLGEEKYGIVGTRAIPDFKNATWVEKAWYKILPAARKSGIVEWLGTSNLFMKKEVFLEVGAFDEKMETAEDVGLCYKVGMIGKKIYLEDRIYTIHMRESKTLRQLFRREIWRGSSSLHSFWNNGFDRRELPSIIVPMLNGIFIYFLIIGGVLGSKYLVPTISLILLFPAAFLVKKRIRLESLQELAKCYMVSFTFVFARTCSLHREIVKAIKKMVVRDC